MKVTIGQQPAVTRSTRCLGLGGQVLLRIKLGRVIAQMRHTQCGYRKTPPSFHWKIMRTREHIIEINHSLIVWHTRGQGVGTQDPTAQNMGQGKPHMCQTFQHRFIDLHSFYRSKHGSGCVRWDAAYS